jgi:hypothetical protein
MLLETRPNIFLRGRCVDVVANLDILILIIVLQGLLKDVPHLCCLLLLLKWLCIILSGLFLKRYSPDLPMRRNGVACTAISKGCWLHKQWAQHFLPLQYWTPRGVNGSIRLLKKSANALVACALFVILWRCERTTSNHPSIFSLHIILDPVHNCEDVCV